jgi:hypothetical protein
MTKTEIIFFCQKKNRIVKLLELSDTLTNALKIPHLNVFFFNFDPIVACKI